jgi:hypothetical protein
LHINFSRHAKRRIKLYDIEEQEIIKIINNEKHIKLGQNEIVRKISGHRYSIKIVFDFEKDYIIVITAYPLKRGFE